MELVHVQSICSPSASVDCNGVYIAAAVNETSVGVWSTQSLDSKLPIMELVHVQSICSPSASVDCNGVYIAAAVNETSVGVWSTQSLDSKPLELVAHTHPLTSVAFGKCYNPTALCTCAEDYVIMWNVEKARHLHETSQQIQGKIVMRNPGRRVVHASFSSDDGLLSLCLGREVHVFNLQVNELYTVLEGHTAAVTCAEFCDHLCNVIITASEDRTFKIWDLASSVLIYQSNIISAYTFVSLAVDPFNETLALGSADGQVRMYDIKTSSGYKLLHQLDVSKLAQKEARKREQTSTGYTAPTNMTSCANGSSISGVAGEVILSLCFLQPHGAVNRRTEVGYADTDLKPQEQVIDHLLEDSSLLLVGTPGAVILIHTRSFEGEIVSFQDPVLTGLGMEEKIIPVADGFAFGSVPGDTKPWCVTTSAFRHSVEVMRLHIPDLTNELPSDFSRQLHVDNGEPSAKDGISVIANVPLMDKSVLRSEMVSKATGKKVTTSTKSATKPGRRIQDGPLTFQQKIKSSGYTSTPRMKMFSPNTRKGTKASAKTMSSVAGGNSRLLKEFPMTCDPPSSRKQSMRVAENACVVTDLSFSADGQSLACALGDKSAQILKMPLTAGTGTCLTGHNSGLNGVSWSHDNAWLLTSSVDKTAKLWMRGSTDPILNLSHLRGSIDSTKPGARGSVTKKDNPLFSHKIEHAQFYYVDKFIILVSGNAFNLYKYHIDTSTDDIKRYETRSRYKLVKQFSMRVANQLTCLSAANGFYSHIVLCCGSDRSIELFDLNVGSRLATIEDSHSRCAHAITQNLGSNYAGLGSSACNMFATSAVTDGIKVWDVRTNHCIRKLEGHSNRAHSCAIKFSPCGRYLVSGSEDKNAYVFDLREGAVFERLTGHSDVVLSIDYHPLYQEIATGCLDGTINLFSDR